jgi:2-methylcitrate dehydratase PrpD
MSQQKDGKLDPKNIESIKVETYSLAAQLCDKAPENMLAAKFSVPFAIATTIIHGHSGVESFLPDKVGRPEIESLSSRIEVEEKQEFTQMMPSRRPSCVTVRLKDGTTFTETVYISKGDIEDPYSTDELETKFLNLATPIYGKRKAKEILEQTKKTETFSNIRKYTEGL